MRISRVFFNLIAFVVLIAAILIVLYSGVGISYAATINYSDVLNDLQEDSNFNVADYPAVNDNYSIQVIQVAESVTGELFVYVYQPAVRVKLLVATSLNMSLSDSVDGTAIYNLSLLNSAGVFQKYLVDGVRVSSDEVRYYNITSIYRKYDGGIDSADVNGNTNEIAFEVAQLWMAKTEVSGNVLYSMTTPEVVTITDIYSSFIRYRSGYWYVWGDATDAHYVAFNTDYEIDRLYDAEVYYEITKVTHHYANMSGRHTYTRGEAVPLCSTLSIMDKGHNTITGFGGVRHSWERIQRADDFIATEADLPAESKEKLQGKQWVLRFDEAPYTKSIPNVVDQFTYDEHYTEFNNVSILRLHFQSAGKVYNLGAVSNKVQPVNPYPAPTNPVTSDFWTWLLNQVKTAPWWVWLIVGLVAFSIVCTILAFVCPPFLAFLELVLQVVGNGLYYLLLAITSPFRWIIRKIKGD